jgi:hypothetical protein
MNNINELTDEEKMIVIDFICCSVGEGFMGYGGLPDIADHGYNNVNIEEQLIVIAYKLGFTQIDIDLHLTKYVNVDFKANIASPELNKEEKAIIVDFISCAVGEGYKGKYDEKYDTNNINEKLATISYKLGFLRDDIGISEAICEETFTKNGISVKRGEKCYFSEGKNDVSIINTKKEYLEITFEEAKRYFRNIMKVKRDN